MIKQYSDKKAINMKTKFIYNEQKGLILPHSTVLKLLIDLQLPVYNFEGNSVCHFKDVCLTATKKALQRNIDSKKDITENRRNIELQFDRIPEEQQKRLDEGWRQKYKNLQRAQLIDDYDTGKLWAGLYILKMMRSVNNGFGRTQFKKKLAQSRLFKKLQRKHHIQKKENIGEKIVDVLKKKTQINESKADMQSEHEFDEDQEEEVGTPKEKSHRGSSNQLVPPTAVGASLAPTDDFKGKGAKGQPGGPQGRGRSPSSKLRDHQKSTWWMQTGPDSLGSGSQSGNYTGARSNQVAPGGQAGWTNTIEITNVGSNLASPNAKRGNNLGDDMPKSARRR
ncbi:hypothetical protein FGO68_gene10298 [Halteria grandinella]|uniref:Uncharacterized protein n=1 Tax=Halteria grandinella TaxID=5974 RepID=A0A8J8NCX3_HALGN|nr:hypothetical protein FGO68_gene10298 [Halteria grandinella]